MLYAVVIAPTSVTVSRTTLDDESNVRAFYSHSQRGARYCVVASDPRDARTLANDYGRAADAGDTGAFAVAMRGRLKSVPVISRRPAMARYVATVKHDAGRVRIAVTAQSDAVARQMIMSAEGCPARSIVAMKREA